MSYNSTFPCLYKPPFALVPSISLSRNISITIDEKMNGRFLRASLRKWRRLDTKESPSGSYDQQCCSWELRPRIQEGEEEIIPKDVPRGHLVVYVGESYKRYVIKVTLLKHPLFRALLDQAQDEYGFTPDSKLCIPCDENIFLEVIRCIANTRPDRRICRLCL